MFFNLLNLPFWEVVGRLDWKREWLGRRERKTHVTYHILNFSFTIALYDIYGLKEELPDWKKAYTNGIHVSEGASYFHQDVSGYSPHLFAVKAGRLHAVYCKYVQVVNLLLALTQNK